MLLLVLTLLLLPHNLSEKFPPLLAKSLSLMRTKVKFYSAARRFTIRSRLNAITAYQKTAVEAYYSAERT